MDMGKMKSLTELYALCLNVNGRGKERASLLNKWLLIIKSRVEVNSTVTFTAEVSTAESRSKRLYSGN
jgi:hypothetical protein